MAIRNFLALGLLCVLAVEAANVGLNEPPTTQLKLVVTVDGHSFFADSTVARSWSDAKIYCESTGMKQAEITSTAQANALVAAYNPDFMGHYWTAGRDAMTHRQFSWDLTDAEVGNYLPFVATMPHSCLKLQVDSSTRGFYENAACTEQLGTLCET